MGWLWRGLLAATLSLWVMEPMGVGACAPSLAYGADDEPPWLADALRTINVRYSKYDGRLVLAEHLLLRRYGKPAWLVAVWRNHRPLSGQSWTLFQVVNGDGAAPVLVPRRSQEGEHYSIAPLSGSDFFGTGDPLLVIDYASGGNQWTTNHLLLFRLGADAVNGGPKHGLPMQFIMDREKHPLLLNEEDRWASFYRSCSSCGPAVRIIYRWSAQGWQGACRDYPGIIQQYTRPFGLAQANVLNLFDFGIENSLAMLQSGNASLARRQYQALFTTAEARFDTRNPKIRHVLDLTRRSFDPVFLHPHRQASCPATDNGAIGGDYGDDGPDSFSDLEE